MKAFFVKILIFIIVLLSLYGLLIHKLSEDYVDIYYNKFTQKAGGLILGISKASKGINPTIMENELQLADYDTPIINFALNVNNSQYGEVYLKAIQKKLKNVQKKQIFVLSVSPGNFAAPLNTDANDIADIDKKTITGKVTVVDAKPNYNYIINSYDKGLYNALHKYEKWEHYNLHENGWLEIKLKNFKSDSLKNNNIKFWKSSVRKYFEQNMKFKEISEYRIECFIKTINYLKPRGHVFIVRIPEDKEFMEAENDFWPNFEKDIDSICNKLNVPFINYSNMAGKFTTYDGLHFDSSGANAFTKMLTKDICLHLKNNP